MTAPRLLSLLHVAAACVLLPTVVTAQYASYPYGFAPGTTPYRAQPMYREDPDDLYYSPRARLRPQQMRPSRDSTSFLSDADPDYSSAGASDEDVDFDETTRTTVIDPTGQSAGTVTIDTARRKLYLTLGNGRALEYGIGVGRQGFAWKGEARVGRKAYWPGWTPPREMLARRPDLPSHMQVAKQIKLGKHGPWSGKYGDCTMSGRAISADQKRGALSSSIRLLRMPYGRLRKKKPDRSSLACKDSLASPVCLTWGG
jgi:hypothetical protein